MRESAAQSAAEFLVGVFGGGAGRDDGAGPVLYGEQSFALELAVGHGDGVEVDAEVGGELTDGRQGRAGFEIAGVYRKRYVPVSSARASRCDR